MTPKWQVQIQDHDGETYWREYEAWDAEAAAVEAAERFDADGDNILCDGGEIVILVKLSGSDLLRKFKCHAEQSYDYFASEIDPKPEPECDIPI